MIDYCLMFLNYFFSCRFCTSIVSQDSKGQIWHSRNLDYGFTDILKNLTIFVDFQKEGKVLDTLQNEIVITVFQNVL